MKKWIIAACLIGSVQLVAYNPKEDEQLMRVLNSEKAEKLNRKVTQFYLTHPKTSRYLHEGGQEVARVFERYYDKAFFLIDQYPNERIMQQMEGRLEGVKEMLDQRDFLIKVGLFLAFGIYDINTYQDAKSWRDLLATQTGIFNHNIRMVTLKREVKRGIEEPEALELLEKNLMETIRVFCQKSNDPFFHNTVLSIIEGCDTREGILKHYKITGTQLEVDDIESEAMEQVIAFNETMMEELKEALKKYFSAESIADQFIEVTSDTFDLPTLPAHLRGCSKGCCKEGGEEEKHHSS